MDKDNSCESVTSNINPLEIYRILQHTLGFLDPCHLGHCRLVNSTWNDAALCLLRQKQCLYLQTVKSFTKFNAAFLSLSDDNPSQSESEPQLQLPYKSCMFGSELMDQDSPNFMGFHSGAQTFLAKFGHCFTKIHLSLGNSNSSAVVNLFQTILFQWMPNLETLSLLVKESPFDFFPDFEAKFFQKLVKLKSLHIQGIGYNNSTEIFDIGQLLTIILAICTNLENISCKMPNFLRNHGQSSSDDFVECSSLDDQVMQCILDFGESSSIIINEKNGPLDIQFLLRTSNNQFESLINCLNPDLQAIYLKLDESVLTDTILEFFQRFAILKSIWIEFPKIVQNIPCVPMINLKKITILDYEGDFSFLNYLPVLKYLEIKSVRTGLPKFKSDSKNCKNTSLASLTMSSKQLMSCPTIGTDLASIFPNLRELTLVNTDNITIQGIFEALPKLNSLHLSGKAITDEGICGESENMLKILLEAAIEQWSNNGELCWDFNPRYPSIGRLKYLQSFSIQAHLITDACLVYGISKCVNLKRLEIRPALELITKFGTSSLLKLQDLESLKIFVRNFGWADLKKLRREIFRT